MSVKSQNFATTIGARAFYGCAKMVSLKLSGTTAIGDYAFGNCAKLKALSATDSLQTIGSYAFYHCFELENFEVGANVTAIGANAFGGCSDLTGVTFAVAEGWTADSVAISATDLQSESTAASYLTATYVSSAWSKNVG